MTLSHQYLTFICLILLLKLSIAQPGSNEFYCHSQYPLVPDYCPEVYEPVCAKYQVQCFRAPCPLLQREYPNGCAACENRFVISYSVGECENSNIYIPLPISNPPPEEKSCRDEYPSPPYPCPKNYDPVCVSHEVVCKKAPCPAIQKEYSNACVACNEEYVDSYKPGPCEEKYKETEGENYENYESCENEEMSNEEDWACEDNFEDYENYEENGEKKICHVIPKVSVLCVQAYIPVCGYFEDCANGICRQTFDNNCVACYYGGADYFTDGECPLEE